MAVVTVRRRSSLAVPWVLAPERYDPRRDSPVEGRSVPLSTVARVVRTVVSPRSTGAQGATAGTGGTGTLVYRVLDTADAREGVVVGWRPPVARGALGSSKKLVVAGDVLISRLRPYLRQVAWVDAAVALAQPPSLLACSTEFYVLRSVDGMSIAFLVPWLLGDGVQGALAASQEGGHHPRVGEASLASLQLPESVLQRRAAISASVARSVGFYRKAEQGLRGLIASVAAPP